MDNGDSTSDSETYHTTHDWERDASLTYTIVKAVAAVKDVDSTALDPLQTTVDTDALDQLVASLQRSAPQDGTGHVEFTLDGYRVVVTSDGEVTVRRQPAERPREEISTEAEFEAALARLIREAEANGVDVDGGWACQDDSAYPEWGIEIFEVDSSR